MFDFRLPMYVVRDPSIIKLCCVKYFDFFENRRAIITEKADKMLGNSLVRIYGGRFCHLL